MNGRFLSGVLSGLALVALSFLLGSALFPVEVARSPGDAAPEASDAATLVPAADAPAGQAGTQPDAVAETAPDAAPAADEMAIPEAAPAASAPEDHSSAATSVDGAPVDLAEKPAEAAEGGGVTEAAESPVATADATTTTAGDAPDAATSPAAGPEPQIAPPAPEPDAAAEASPDLSPASEPAALPDLARLDAGAVLAALDDAAKTGAAEVAVVDPALPTPPTTAPKAPDAAPDAGENAAQPEIVPEAPASPQPDVASKAEAPAAGAMAEPEPPADVAPETAPEGGETDPAKQPDSDAADMPGTVPDALPDAEAPVPEPESAAMPADDTSESTFKPAPGLGDKTEGVIVGRLPRIGEVTLDDALPADDAALPDAAAPAADADQRPIVQYAATFENPEGKPTFALVLLDPGTADLDRASLAALPFPVSFALDPMDPATPERAAIYRAAGREVVMLSTGIAAGAQASDIEVAFQSMAQSLPEAVAVMDLVEPTFQNRRPLASIVVPVVGAQGRGLLTWDEGLNAADQVARREDVPATMLFRDLNSAGTDTVAIRRVLDRAVFKAGQDGRVAVAGTVTPELVAALLEWTVEGRAATVALGPVTAVLTVE